MDWLKKLKQANGSSDDSIFCDFLKEGVPKDECHKPLSCFYRNEDDKPVECQHLKTFVKQRNKELGIQI